MRTSLFVPFVDYLKTRKRLHIKFLMPIIFALVVLTTLQTFIFIDYIVIDEVLSIFSTIINVQVNVIAILLSFSIAIMTILVSSDSGSLQRLKEEYDEYGRYKGLKNDKYDGGCRQLSLFQIMLSNITYVVFIEIAYLVILVLFVIFQMVLPPQVILFLIPVCVFFIIHILHVLLESVSFMYLTFWR